MGCIMICLQMFNIAPNLRPFTCNYCERYGITITRLIRRTCCEYCKLTIDISLLIPILVQQKVLVLSKLFLLVTNENINFG